MIHELKLLGILVLFGFVGAVLLLTITGVLTVITKFIKRYIK